MVEAVDPDLRLAERTGQQAVRFDVDTVYQQIARFAIVLAMGGLLDVQVLPQRACARNVQDLDAAAYSEQRQSIRDRPAGQRQLDLVQLGHDVEVAVLSCDSAVTVRFDVRTAGQEQAVEELVVKADAVDVLSLIHISEPT